MYHRSLLLSYTLETCFRKVKLSALLLVIAVSIDLYALVAVLSTGPYATYVFSLVLISGVGRIAMFRFVINPTIAPHTSVPLSPVLVASGLSLIYILTYCCCISVHSGLSDLAQYVSALPSSPIEGQFGLWNHLANASFLVVYLAYPGYFYGLLLLSRWSNIQFTALLVSLLGALFLWISTASPSFGIARYSAFCLSAFALTSISYECYQTLQSGTVGGMVAGNTRHLYRAKQIEELCRLTLTNFIVNTLLRPIISLCSLLSPTELMYYLHPTPIFNMGNRCDYGIAYQVNGEPQHRPQVFQYNVGHFGGSYYDLIHTTTATRDMMLELRDDPESGKKGFVSDMVAMFPILSTGGGKPHTIFHPNSLLAAVGYQQTEPPYRVREVNISAWASEKAAHDWYVNSAVHQQIVQDYRGGSSSLKQFSTMLATLQSSPDKPIRWEVRCRRCVQLSPGPGNGVCPHCGDTSLQPLPYM